MARRKADGLMEIGRDAFASLDDYHRRNTGQARQPNQLASAHRKNPTYVPWISACEGINCDEAGKRNYNDIPKPAAGEVINCNDAAIKYGGVLFKERGRKKKSFFGFSFGFPKAK